VVTPKIQDFVLEPLVEHEEKTTNTFNSDGAHEIIKDRSKKRIIKDRHVQIGL
jgi:hypothetical protein